MMKPTTYVGMDVHKQQIFVSVVPGQGEPLEEWKLSNEPKAVKRLSGRLKKYQVAGPISCVYEAGPCGFVLQRQLLKAGIPTDVIAPSLVPSKPGERVKTDRRDARKLAMAARAQTLTVVRPPTETEECARDLCRCRDDARKDLTRGRHRLTKLLLRRGLVYRIGKNWTQAHRRWLSALRFEDSSTRTIFNDYLMAVESLEDRIQNLKTAITELATEAPYRDPVGWLRCFRGIDTVTAMTLVTELHGFERFLEPRQLMAYLGLTPSEHSSGGRTRRAGITKSGNSHARRVLVEAAWHYRHRPGISPALSKRRQAQPGSMVILADKAQRRLHQRYHRLVGSYRKPPQLAVVAVARELAGFVWAALHPAAALPESGGSA